MTDRFTELIRELANVFGLPLFVDHNKACVLQIHEKIRIQLQSNLEETHLLMACIAIEIPPGKFRENVLKEGLKTNSLPDPRPAIVGYLAQNNHLAFHQSLPFNILDGQRLAGFFSVFLTEVEKWIKAIEEGRSGP